MKIGMILVLFILLVIATRVFRNPSLECDISPDYNPIILDYRRSFPLTNNTPCSLTLYKKDSSVLAPTFIDSNTSKTLYLNCSPSGFLPYPCSGSGSAIYYMFYYGTGIGTLTVDMATYQSFTNVNYSLQVNLDTTWNYIVRKNRTEIILEPREG